MKSIQINNIEFEIVNPNTKQGERIIYNACHPWKKYEDIADTYGRPSIVKCNIWTFWKKWYKESNIKSGNIWICSRCSNYFSIAFTGFLGEHEIYGYITYAHNKVVII